MNPILLQKQLKENAADLDEFYKDLKNWGEDMKRKEGSQSKFSNNNNQNNKKRKNVFVEKKESQESVSSVDEKPKTKIGSTDYSAWEKFDVEAECEKIDYDENDESELTDECDEARRDEAYVEKEKGNKYVRKEQWEEAIKCYTKAIDCYSFDPVFYANRALCFLKLKNMTKAEADCTMSLKLDDTYVKAYQRRAAAREALNKLEEAEVDYLKVLELEPKNKESKAALEKLRIKISENKKATKDAGIRPMSKFTASRQQMKKNTSLTSMKYDASTNTKRGEIVTDSGEESSSLSSELKRNVTTHDAATKTINYKQEKMIDESNASVYWPSGSDNIMLVKTVNKPVHLRSKKPLKRIEISEAEEIIESSSSSESVPKTNWSNATLKTDDLKVIERNEPSTSNYEKIKETKNQANTSKMNDERVEMCVPKTSVQFYSQWKRLKTLENKYNYFKLIEAEKLPNIFKESLESSVLSEILEVLTKCFVSKGDKIYDYLWFLTRIKRFATIVLFMSDNEKNCVRKLVDHVIEYEDRSREEIDDLIEIYELY